MENKDLKLLDTIDYIKNKLGKSEWIAVFEFIENKSYDQGTYFSALISNKNVSDSLKKYDWDLRLSDGRPGFSTTYKNGKSKTKYYRFLDKNIESFVYVRFFNGKEKILEISEEFRLFFDLYEKYIDQNNKIYINTDEDGDENEVARISKNKIEIKLKYLKEYLSIKKKSLAIYYEFTRFSDKKIEDLDIDFADKIESGEDYIYHLSIRNLSLDERQSIGSILGKKIIKGLKRYSPPDILKPDKSKFEKYIINTDSDGNDVLSTCNIGYQSEVHYLTPIFFKKEVLRKYYDSPAKYTVDDGYLKCDGFWSLRMMNNHLDHVVVWLGDLKGLPHKEQTYWKGFNLTPDNRKISHADFERNINGEFSDPENPEYYFKYKFEDFQEKWNKKFGWYLFKKLNEDDNHHLKSLHVPTTNEQKEFDEQIISITKILIDSLNEAMLNKGISLEIENPKGIDKLEGFLKNKGVVFKEMISFLRNLQSLRSTGVAHRKGTKYEEVKKIFGVGDKEFKDVFDDILIKCIWTLNSLESKLLS